jgi:hypothetical protein
MSRTSKATRPDRQAGVRPAEQLTDNGAPVNPWPESVIEQLAELWCEALLANLRRHPVPRPVSSAS